MRINDWKQHEKSWKITSNMGPEIVNNPEKSGKDQENNASEKYKKIVDFWPGEKKRPWDAQTLKSKEEQLLFSR